MKKILLDSNKNFYKGNMHCHSNLSDGKLSPEELKEQFDYIIVDLPPVNIVSDALSISGLITGMIIVVREEYTEKKELERCFRQLKLSNVNVLGCVMNETKSGGGSYGKYKKYKYYKYYRYYQSSGKDGTT